MKSRKNNILKKILIVPILIIILFNTIVPNYSQADIGTMISSAIAGLFANIVDAANWVISGLVAGGNFDVYVTDESERGKVIDANQQNINKYKKVKVENIVRDYGVPQVPITPYEIFSNKLAILNPNYFNSESDWDKQIGYKEGDKENNRAIALILKESVTKWYRTLWMISVVGLMSALVYIGIRIVISSATTQKVKYKNALTDWLIAMCLVFFLHYIMVFTLTMVDEVVNLIANTNDIYEDDSRDYPLTKVVGTKQVTIELIDTDGNTKTWVANMPELMRVNILRDKPSVQWASLALYAGLTAYTVVFAIKYIKRLITMTFLTLIAPLIALTYPIDKVKDGTAQAFNYWLREYIMNAILPVIHIILWEVLITSAADIVTVAPLYAIVAMAFFSPAEKMIREMFGFSSSTAPSSAAGFAAGSLATQALGTLKDLGKSRNKVGGNQNNRIRTDDPMTDPSISSDSAYSSMASEGTRDRLGTGGPPTPGGDPTGGNPPTTPGNSDGSEESGMPRQLGLPGDNGTGDGSVYGDDLSGYLSGADWNDYPEIDTAATAAAAGAATGAALTDSSPQGLNSGNRDQSSEEKNVEDKIREISDTAQNIKEDDEEKDEEFTRSDDGKTSREMKDRNLRQIFRDDMRNVGKKVIADPARKAANKIGNTKLANNAKTLGRNAAFTAKQVGGAVSSGARAVGSKASSGARKVGGAVSSRARTVGGGVSDFMQRGERRRALVNAGKWAGSGIRRGTIKGARGVAKRIGKVPGVAKRVGTNLVKAGRRRLGYNENARFGITRGVIKGAAKKATKFTLAAGTAAIVGGLAIPASNIRTVWAAMAGGAAFGRHIGDNIFESSKSKTGRIRDAVNEGLHGREEAQLRRQDREFMSESQYEIKKQLEAERPNQRIGMADVRARAKTYKKYYRAGLTDLKQMQNLEKLRRQNGMTEEQAINRAKMVSDLGKDYFRVKDQDKNTAELAKKLMVGGMNSDDAQQKARDLMEDGWQIVNGVRPTPLGLRDAPAAPATPETAAPATPDSAARPEPGRPATPDSAARPEPGRPATPDSAARPELGRPATPDSAARPEPGRPATPDSATRPAPAGTGASNRRGRGTGTGRGTGRGKGRGRGRGKNNIP